MKRYRMQTYCYSNKDINITARVDAIESPDGEWVKWEDVLQMLKDLQEGKPIEMRLPVDKKDWKGIVGTCKE